MNGHLRYLFASATIFLLSSCSSTPNDLHSGSQSISVLEDSDFPDSVDSDYFALKNLHSQQENGWLTGSSLGGIGGPAGSRPNYAIVPVYYATDRARIAGGAENGWYGGGRGELQLGLAEVAIPRDHALGELESPSLLRLEFSQDPNLHVVTLKATQLRPSDFYSRARASIAKSSKKASFIFIHGYNVTFSDAIRRTGQIAYDLGFDGAAVAYSWPSQGRVASYPADEQNIEWTQSHFERFLVEYARGSGSDDIYLIGHSMGNRALTRALASLASQRHEVLERFEEIVLTAPDIDADVFQRDLAPAMARSGRPITLYASTADKALIASKRFHGGHPRAGDSGSSLVVVTGIETIDATMVSTDFLGHSYIGERNMLADLFQLFGARHRASSRFGLTEKSSPSGRYWEFQQ